MLRFLRQSALTSLQQKPGNVFLDSEGNIRLGDFGLATRHTSRAGVHGADDNPSPELSTIYDAIEDISGLLGGSAQDSVDNYRPGGESLTGGVGTTFYRAPEQEGGEGRRKGNRTYDVQADIFSLGIVLFEIFHPPFATYMERAEVLKTLRGEGASIHSGWKGFNPKGDNSAWKEVAEQRFRTTFIESTPHDGQKLILWCLQRDPTKRPTAQEILNSNLLPRKMELEKHYLKEALHTLANPQSESYLQILEVLFARSTSDLVEVTFDGDVAAKANNMGGVIGPRDGARQKSLPDEIMKAIGNIRATGSLDVASLRSVAMSASSLISATAALRRARLARNYW